MATEMAQLIGGPCDGDTRAMEGRKLWEWSPCGRPVTYRARIRILVRSGESTASPDAVREPWWEFVGYGHR
jgi:hypothetical protein